MFDLHGFVIICIYENNTIVGSQLHGSHPGLLLPRGLQQPLFTTFRSFNLKWFSFKTNSMWCEPRTLNHYLLPNQRACLVGRRRAIACSNWWTMWPFSGSATDPSPIIFCENTGPFTSSMLITSLQRNAPSVTPLKVASAFWTAVIWLGVTGRQLHPNQERLGCQISCTSAVRRLLGRTLSFHDKPRSAFSFPFFSFRLFQRP